MDDNTCQEPRNNEGRMAFMEPPKYQVGVLEANWQFREDAVPKAALPKFKGCSIYTTSYKSPPKDSYNFDDLSSWDNRQKCEGGDLLSSGGNKECINNFTTTTDLVYRIMPQICPKSREYNTNLSEWMPPQTFLPCVGNLTQFGLTEAKRKEWQLDEESRKMLMTTMREHYVKPCPEFLVRCRRATPRALSSQLDPTNIMMVKKKTSGGRLQVRLQVPNLQPGALPIPEWRCPLPIQPALPLEPAVRVHRPEDESAGLAKHRFGALKRFTGGFASMPHLCRVPCI